VLPPGIVSRTTNDEAINIPCVRRGLVKAKWRLQPAKEKRNVTYITRIAIIDSYVESAPWEMGAMEARWRPEGSRRC
jgi:hypothetical protein